jgi:hypothetical protein
MDFSFLGEIEPYEAGYLKEKIDSNNIERELETIGREMDGLCIDSLRFDRWDFAAIFATALLEVGADFLLGDPKKGLSKNLSDKNTSLGNYFSGIHEGIDHTGNPLDYQGYKFGGGNHRSRTFGHDLLMFPLALYSLCQGQFVDGYYDQKKIQWVLSCLNQKGHAYAALPVDEAVTAYFAHMFADFFSAKSLPVPGFGVLAHLPDRELRKLVADMYSDGFNLRHMVVQGIPVAATEILIRLYLYFRVLESEPSAEARKHKLDKMLLMTHTLAALVNVGKVVLTNNPAAINLPMMLRVIWLTWSVVKEELELTHRAKVKVNYSVLKNKYETLQTLVLLDESVYYTREINKFIVKKKDEFVIQFYENEHAIQNGFNELDQLMAEFTQLNQSIKEQP